MTDTKGCTPLKLFDKMEERLTERGLMFLLSLGSSGDEEGILGVCELFMRNRFKFIFVIILKNSVWYFSRILSEEKLKKRRQLKNA
jgi:hypothetical protein